MSIRKKLRKTLDAGEQSSLPQYGLKEIISTLAGSLREFGKPAWATPFLVTGEVVLECAIPFVTAQLIDALALGGGVSAIAGHAAVLIVMALASLAFGTAAGVTCSIAATGLAKNLRHDVFHKIHNFCVVDMSNFYLDVLKDRLYVEKTDGATRRAAQTTI